MKYAKLSYGKNPKQASNGQYVNLGDYFQTFAIENIYSILNIPASKIQTIDRVELQHYQGEELLLPMQGWFGYIKGIEIFPLPSKIKPVFLGFHCIQKNIIKKYLLTDFKNNTPLGCRDEQTYLLMQEYGVNSYLTGCLTITLPERKQQPTDTHVFLVDAPNNIEKYMPDNLKENITYITQEIPIQPDNDNADEIKRTSDLAKTLLDRYRDEATLVVTSRLHCAAPCLGMGIPVILARNYFDERYGWIDKFLPLYTPDKFESINWYPDKIDLSEVKPKLIEMASKVIFDTPDKEEAMKQIHDYYMSRNKTKLQTPFYVKQYLNLHTKFPKLADFLREVLLQRFTVATARNKSEI